MKIDYKIRRFIWGDVKQLTELMEKYLKEEGTDIPLQSGWQRGMEEYLHTLLKTSYITDDAEIFVALEQKPTTGYERVAGFIIVEKVDDHIFVPYGLIAGLYVHPDYRHGSVAIRLIERARVWFDDNDIRFVKTEVRGKNEDRLYYTDREGFEKKATIMVSDRGGINAKRI